MRLDNSQQNTYSAKHGDESAVLSIDGLSMADTHRLGVFIPAGQDKGGRISHHKRKD